MARSHFRSQPSLQRTGRHAGNSWWWLILLAASGIVIGVYSVGPGDLLPRVKAGAPRSEPAPQQLAEARTAPAPAEVVAIAPPVAQPPPVAPKAPALTAHITPPGPAPAPPRALTPMERYARGGDPYEEEMRAYNAGERQAGFSWAADNRVRGRLQCEAVRRQRTAPFALGCLDYLRERRGG
jgi:hypothetical protein